MNDESAVTIRELISSTAEVIGARNEARWLVEVATALDGAALDAAMDDPVTIRMVHHLDAMVARYRTGEPLPYVLGRWGFRHLDLAVDARVLIPRPETELVAETAISLARAAGPDRRVADLGTGSGAIGLSVAHELPLDGTVVWLTDVDDDALDVARANLAGIGRAARNVRIARGSWYDALPAGERFDVIVSNPPYVADSSPLLEADVLDWEPAGALFAGADGLDDIRILAEGGIDRLRVGGWLVLEIGTDQGAAVGDLLRSSGYVDVDVRPDHAGHDRIAVGRRSD